MQDFKKMKKHEEIKVVICMGSSCFARGNKDNLEYLEYLAEENDLDIKIDLIGTRCENKCAEGPNIIINGKLYNNVTRNDLEELLFKYTLIRS
jgi:NADH:ubiquinone oxidoreductase subunit E